MMNLNFMKYFNKKKIYTIYVNDKSADRYWFSISSVLFPGEPRNDLIKANHKAWKCYAQLATTKQDSNISDDRTDFFFFVQLKTNR